MQSFLSKISQLNTLYVGTIFFVLILFCYGNTLSNGLFFDDEQFIYNNTYVKNFDLGGILGKSLSSESGQISNYYRPLLFLGFSIEYQLFKDAGIIYHFDSFTLHFLGSLLLFLLLKKLFQNQLLAFVTSLLFLIHPIQAEAVAYASGRGDPLSFVFIILTLLLVISKNKTHHLISYLSLIAALLSKEIALMTPGLIFIVLLFSKKSLSRHALYKSMVQTLPFIFITGGYFLLRITVLNFNNTLNFYNSQNVYSSSLLVRMYTFFTILPSYLGLLIFPKELFMERDSAIKIFTYPVLKTIISFGSVVIFFILSLWKRKQYPILLFSLLWIGIAFIPASGIIPINGIFYEHFLYGPSVGFFLLLSDGIVKLVEKLSSTFQSVVVILICCIVLTICIRTIARNVEWHDAITFYNQTLSHVQSPRAYNNLAMAYAETGDNKDAITAYKKAISLSDAYPESHYNLGNAYASLHDIQNAETEYKNALRISPSFYLSYIKLYSLYKATNNQSGLNFVYESLTNLGKVNQQFLLLRDQLKAQP